MKIDKHIKDMKRIRAMTLAAFISGFITAVVYLFVLILKEQHLGAFLTLAGALLGIMFAIYYIAETVLDYMTDQRNGQLDREEP